jgi:hypothetical protein
VVVKWLHSVCAIAAGALAAGALVLLWHPAMPAANAQQPRFPQGFQRPGGDRVPPDPAEVAAYSAAISESDLDARISAIQQFLNDYPQSNMRQAAMSQMMAAKREAQAAAQSASRTQQVSAPPVVAPAPVAPTGPLPDSLLQRPAKQAEITIAGRSLTIKADNSDLSQILQSISNSTGMKVEGLSTGKEERIFGNYGPGDPHEVLLAILEGCGYNVMMLGDTAEGAPRELSLSQRSATVAQASTPGRPNQEEEDDDQDVQQAAPEPPPPPTPPPSAPSENQQPQRTPQEVLQELQRLRQQGQGQQGQQPQSNQ